ncbi:MAG: thioredoxin family protein [Balneolaceae bacterium]|nr:thioredoxin family protein [Balneolaceae bacterium]
MSAIPSIMLKLGTKAPNFNLPSVNGGNLTLNYTKNSKAFVVMFICNHCPYVQHIENELVSLTKEYIQQGIAFIAISSNNVEEYPDDSPEKMAKKNYPFPYLYDESQEVAKAYKAACTPDFFVFDENSELAYRGQFDDSRPGNDKAVTGTDLREALDHILEGKEVSKDQAPSVGCNIKWKAGNEPEYFK